MYAQVIEGGTTPERRDAIDRIVTDEIIPALGAEISGIELSSTDGRPDAGLLILLGPLTKPFGFRELRTRSGLVACSVKDIGAQGDDVAVLRGIRGGFDRGDFLVEPFLSGLDQRPHNVRICGVRGRSAEAVDGHGATLEPAVAVST